MVPPLNVIYLRYPARQGLRPGRLPPREGTVGPGPPDFPPLLIMNSIGGQNNKGKKHTKQQNEAKSERMKGHTPGNKLKPEQLEFAMKYGVLYAEFETEAGGGPKFVQFKRKYPEFTLFE